MAIQQVGGQGVYVITGSGRDPRRASNGESWADLVTKQKYMLYKSAYDQAMREYESGSISAKQRNRRIENMRDEILRERRDISKAEDQLRRQMLRGEERREEIEYKQKAAGSRQRSSTSGQKGVKQEIPTKRTYLSELDSRISKLSTDNARLEGANESLEPKITKGRIKYESDSDLFGFILDPTTNSEITYQTNAETIKENNKTIQKLREDISKLKGYKTKEMFEEWYRANELPTITFTEGQPGTTSSSKSGYAGPIGSVDYTEVQDELAARKKALDLELDALEKDKIDESPVDVLQRTSEISKERYGLGQPRRKLFGRRAEMEALGMEPEEQPQAENVDTVAEEIKKGRVLDTPVSAPTAQKYIVQKGDTLGTIAQKYYGDAQRYKDIAKASGIQDPNRISVGQQLLIPQDSFTEESDLQPSVVQNVTDDFEFEFQPSVVQNVTDEAMQPMAEDVLEEQAIEPIQPKPAQTEIGDALRQMVLDKEAKKEMMENQQLPESTPPSLMPSPTPALTDAISRQPSPNIRRLGKMASYKEAMAEASAYVPMDPITQQFEEVKNLSVKEKQATALHLLAQAKEAYGVSSKEFQKTKQRILETLAKTIDPKKARNMKRVKTLQNNKPGQYHTLGDSIKGLQPDTKQLVLALFPIANDIKPNKIEGLYNNAQQQIKLSISNPIQKRKALDMLDLMYLAVIEDNR